MARGQDTRWDPRRQVTKIAQPGAWFERFEGERHRGLTPVEGGEARLGSPAGSVQRAHGVGVPPKDLRDRGFAVNRSGSGWTDAGSGGGMTVYPESIAARDARRVAAWKERNG